MNKLETISNNLPAGLTLFIVILVVLEWILITITNKYHKHKEAWVNIFSAILSFLPQFLLSKVFFLIIMFWVHNYKVFELGFDWYIWLLCWIIYDFIFWLIHFLSHKIRLLWCLHSIHHSAKEMKLSVAFRGSFFDFLLIPHNILWLPFLGFNPFLVLIIDSLGKLYGVYVHINEDWVPNKKRRFIEKILISPSAHRVHHSTNHIYLDTNYGELFSIWDRLFGTYQDELNIEKPVYGLTKEVDSENLYDTQSNEFISLWKDIKSTNNIIDKIKYLIMPPGWNHIDGGILAKDIRNEALKNINQSNINS